LSASSLLAGVAIYLLKHIFLRARPIGSIIQETGFSFPSGHAMIAMTMFGVFMYFSLRMKSQSKKIFYMIVCILAIIVVGFSRIYLNVHWFSDVIASYCFGLFILFLVLFGERAIKKF
jgi:undecaprenyl-diphosphatase